MNRAELVPPGMPTTFLYPGPASIGSCKQGQRVVTEGLGLELDPRNIGGKLTLVRSDP